MFPGPDLPPKATKAQRDARNREFEAWAAAERARVAAQRAAFAKAYGPSADLQRLMLDRAWALLEAGECEAADALLEFVPEWAATQLLDEFFPDI